MSTSDAAKEGGWRLGTHLAKDVSVGRSGPLTAYKGDRRA